MALPRPGPGSRALRTGRRSEPGRCYFLTTTTRGRARVFAEFAAGCTMARLLDDAATWAGAELLAWVLMPDHLHVLLELRARPLDVVMRRAKGVTAFRFNTATARLGPLWAPGFHDRAIRSQENLRDAARYLVANPLRAGLVDDIGRYPFWNTAWTTRDCIL